MKTKEYLNIRKNGHTASLTPAVCRFLMGKYPYGKLPPTGNSSKIPIICNICFERCSRRIVSGLEKSMSVATAVCGISGHYNAPSGPLRPGSYSCSQYTQTRSSQTRPRSSSSRQSSLATGNHFPKVHVLPVSQQHMGNPEGFRKYQVVPDGAGSCQPFSTVWRQLSGKFMQSSRLATHIIP